MKPRRFPMSAVPALFLALVLPVSSVRAAPRPVVLSETGSTLLYPLFNLWAARYTRLVPGTRITTEGTGSGTGIAQSLSGLVTLGASDAYASNYLARLHPNLLNIPLAISSQMVNYHLPHLDNRSLRLSGPVLAAIYEGRIRRWNAPAIQALNPGLPLPDHRIVVVHRSDGSGDTFIFTQYLSFTTPGWAKTVGYGTTVNWPAVPGEIGATGNPGMVEALQTTPYAIAYVGVSYAAAIRREHLGTARLENRAGRFVPLTPATVEAAARARVARTPADERLSLVDAPGANAYPIVNYEYVMVEAHQPSARVARALHRFLAWCLSPQGGSAPAFLDRVGFVRLPASVRVLSLRQVARIR
jgi:phosphate transport system substrate-binding protein